MSKMKQRNDIHCVMTEKGLVCENTWIFTTGRIKRRKGITKRSTKKEIKFAYDFWINDMYFNFPITRWNRH